MEDISRLGQISFLEFILEDVTGCKSITSQMEVFDLHPVTSTRT